MSADRYNELAQSWLQAAQTDLSVAELVLQKGYFASACFHAQQAAEKALKAYLFSQGRELIRTHFLPRLLQECQSFNAGFGQLSEPCKVLTVYHTDTRYPETPDTLEGYDIGAAHEALVFARQIVGHVQRELITR